MEELTIKENWKAVFKNPDTKITLIISGVIFFLPIILMVGFPLYIYFTEDGVSLGRALLGITPFLFIYLLLGILPLVLVIVLSRWSAIKSPKTFVFSYKSGQVLIKEDSNIVVDVPLSNFLGLSCERWRVSFFATHKNTIFIPETYNKAVAESTDCKRFLKRLVSLSVFYKAKDFHEKEKNIPLTNVLRKDRISLYHFFQQILKDKEKQLNEL